ncbi:MAG TPA: ferredoxin:thioredoxin reductase, partial [archaeon]|nr:ferredoxin:thioredoxin reductase [archaeon]
QVIAGLVANEASHGYRFCPCRTITGNLEEDKPKICPCKWHVDEIERDGFCKCKLFYAPKKEG